MARTSSQGTQMLAQWTVQLIRESGLSTRETSEMLGAFGLDLDALAAVDSTIPHAAACEVWRRLASDKPSDFGVQFSARFDIRGLGLVGYLAAASATLGDMLTRVVRFHDLVKRPPTAVLTRGPNEFAIVETAPPLAEPWPRPLAESILGAYLSIPRRLTGKSFDAVCVRFQHAAPPRPREVERFFGCPVEYRSHVNELVYPGDAWDLPIATGDPVLLGYLETLAGQQGARSELERVRVHVAQSLSAGRPSSLAEAARALALSPRTLQRRLLEAHDLTFRELVDDVRRTTAERLLAEPCLNLDEVSYLLGFRDPSALRKARRRWGWEVSRPDRSLT